MFEGEGVQLPRNPPVSIIYDYCEGILASHHVKDVVLLFLGFTVREKTIRTIQPQTDLCMNRCIWN